jgi:hypothetical protein
MSVRSGPSANEPFAHFDPDTSSWRTSQLSLPLGNSSESQPAWPRAGIASRGSAFPLPPWAPRISARGSSSSPLLKTPTAQLAVNGGAQHPDKRKAGGHGPTLADEVEFLLPTPLASMNGPSQREIAARDGREQGRPESARVERRPDAAEHGGAAADADRGGRGLVERGEPSVEARDDADGRSALDWAGYTPAILRWEAILGRPAPAPTVVGARGGRVLNPALPEWMMGLPDGWITTVPGLTRAQQLKLAGNGVVKHQAVAAYRYLLDVLERDSATQEKSA